MEPVGGLSNIGHTIPLTSYVIASPQTAVENYPFQISAMQLDAGKYCQ